MPETRPRHLAKSRRRSQPRPLLSQTTQRYYLAEKDIRRLAEQLESQMIVMRPSKNLTGSEDDPADNRYLACPLARQASFIVSEDRHVLYLRLRPGSQILTPTGSTTFLELRR